jgi:hypothetical protein
MQSFIGVLRSRLTSLVQGFQPTSRAVVYNKEALLAFFPRGEKLEREDDISAVRELLQRQVGGNNTEPFVVPKQKCKHGFLQVKGLRVP